MRWLVLILSLLSFSAFAADKHSFAPDNDLWMEDSLYFESNITQDMFKAVVDAGKEMYTPFATKMKEKLVINALWMDSTVNANACRGCRPGQAIINMYGGLARRKEVHPESFALVLCHELGHLYGGAPYIAPLQMMSAEGQADYYSTYACFKRVASKISSFGKPRSEYEPFIENSCTTVKCKNALVGAKGLGNLLAVLSREPEPDFNTPDPTVVDETQVSYPDTVQCRLDSYAAGTFRKPRPACWFKD